jgi:hypothetical protein
LIENIIMTHKASRYIKLLDLNTTTILPWYIDPNVYYGSEYESETENVCPDYIHSSLMDEVKAATTIVACAATKIDLSLPYSDDIIDDPMGP